MIAIVLQEKGGEARRLVFDKTEVIVGRVQGNDIVLPKGNVSKRHARIQLGNGKIVVSDHKSTNGTYVNGRKITSPLVVRSADKIYIGDYILTVEEVPDEPKASLGWEQADNPSQVTPPVEEAGEEIDLGVQSSSSIEVDGMSEASLPPRAAGGPPSHGIDLPSARGESAPPPLGSSGLLPPPGFVAGRGSSSSGSSQGLPAAPFPRADSAAQPGPMPGVEALRPPVPRLEPRGAIPGFPGGAPAPGPAAASGMFPTPVALAPQDPFAPPTATPGAAVSPPPRHPQPGASQSANALPMVEAPPPAAIQRPRRSTAQRELLPRGFFVPQLSADQRRVLGVTQRIVDQVSSQLGIDALTPPQLAEEALWQRAERAVNEAVIVAGRSGQFGDAAYDPEHVGREVLNEVLGWGLLEDYLGDDAVDAVSFDRYDSIAIRRDGKWEAPGRAFSSEDSLRRIVERIAMAFGIPWQLGVIDIPLRSGVRLTAVMPPASAHVAGTVRKVRQGTHRLDALVSQGALSAAAAEHLRAAVLERRGLAVVGPVASARVSLVSALLAEIAPGERLVSVEDAADLSVARSNHIALERRGQDSASVLAAALALRPDRLIVTDPGLETLPVLAALTTALDGGVMAWSAISASEALERLAAVAAVGRNVDALSVRQLMTLALPVVVTCAADGRGELKVTEIAELSLHGGQWRLDRVSL